MMTQKNFIEHLIELRQCLIKIGMFIALSFLVLFYFSDHIYTYLALPILKHLAAGHTLIATNVAAPLFTPLKLSFYLSVFLTAPYAIYQLWSFIAPGLYKKEKFLAWPIIFSSIMLFYLGVVFSYFVVFPLMFGLFAKVVPQGVTLMPDMSSYLDFIVSMFLAFGTVFEVPVVVIVLVSTGMVSIQKLTEIRPYVVVMAFTVGMLLTPPDVLSQVMLAIPICLLYEFGIVMAKFFVIPQAQSAIRDSSD